MVDAARLPVDINATADQMAQEMFGDSMQIVSATYTGDVNSSGIYSNGDSVSPGATPSDTGVIFSTGATQFYTNTAGEDDEGNAFEANQRENTSFNSQGVDNDAGMNEIAGTPTFDAALFDAEFIPDGDTLSMQFVFSSEEYLEFVDQGFNDVVGFWVNGELVPLTIGDGDTSIDNINDQSNQNQFIDNRNDVVNTEMDGLTITLSVKAPVNAGEVNTLRIGIADGGDAFYDSNLLIAGDSIQSETIAADDRILMEQNDTQTVDVLDNDSSVAGGMFITHINNVPVVAGQSVQLPSGEIITLNPDGTLTLQTDNDIGTNAFTYQVADSDGNTDVGTVNLKTIPCFLAGTPLATPQGPRLIETLRPGDLVLTPNGPRPLHWVGKMTTRALGRHAPVIFDTGALGNTAPLAVSPQHRMQVQSAHADLLFGTPTVLVPALHFVNNRTIHRDTSGRAITYIHVMLDSHEMVQTHGIWSESFFPNPDLLSADQSATAAELAEFFPNQAFNTPETLAKIGARPVRKYEAEVLLSALALRH